MSATNTHHPDQLRTLIDLMIVLLVAGSAASYYVGDFRAAFVFAAVAVCNALLAGRTRFDRTNGDAITLLRRETRHITIRTTIAALLICVIFLPAAMGLGLSVRDAVLFTAAITGSLLPYGLAAGLNAALAQAGAKLAATKVLTNGQTAIENLGMVEIVLIDGAAMAHAVPDGTDTTGPKRYNRTWNAMDVARKAHIRVSMIADGPAATAKAIALRIGFAKSADELEIVPGKQLRRMHDGEIHGLIRGSGVIFTRLTSEDKLRIINLARHGGKVVAVAGSKTDDIPALLRADLGIAMGPSISETVRRSADIVLPDGRFTTLIGAIQDGRIILQNSLKGMASAVTTHVAGLTVVLCSLAAAAAFHAPLSIAVVQLFAINLLAGLLPLAALSRDKTDGEPMGTTPHAAARSIISRQTAPGLLGSGLLMGGLAFANYLWFFERQGIDAANLAPGSHIHMQATSLTYLTLAIAQVINILQHRTDKGIFSRYQLHNRHFWLALALFLFLVANTIHNPLLAPHFMAAALDAQDWLYALGAAGIFLVIREFQRHNRKHHRKAVIELHRRVHAPTAT